MVDDSRGNSVFLTQQEWCRYELTEIVITCTRPAHVQTRQNPRTVKEKYTQIPLVTVGTYSERQNQFSPREYPWVYHSHFKVGFMTRSNCPMQNVLYGMFVWWAFCLIFFCFGIILSYCFFVFMNAFHFFHPFEKLCKFLLVVTIYFKFYIFIVKDQLLPINLKSKLYRFI